MMELVSFEVLWEGLFRFMAKSGRTAPVAGHTCPQKARGRSSLHSVWVFFLVVHEGAAAKAGSLVGPSTQLTLPLRMSDEQGVEQPLDMEACVFLVGFSQGVLGLLRDLGNDLIAEINFSSPPLQPEAMPLSPSCCQLPGPGFQKPAWTGLLPFTLQWRRLLERAADFHETASGRRPDCTGRSGQASASATVPASKGLGLPRQPSML